MRLLRKVMSNRRRKRAAEVARREQEIAGVMARQRALQDAHRQRALEDQEAAAAATAAGAVANARSPRMIGVGGDRSAAGGTAGSGEQQHGSGGPDATPQDYVRGAVAAAAAGAGQTPPAVQVGHVRRSVAAGPLCSPPSRVEGKSAAHCHSPTCMCVCRCVLVWCMAGAPQLPAGTAGCSGTQVCAAGTSRALCGMPAAAALHPLSSSHTHHACHSARRTRSWRNS